MNETLPLKIFTFEPKKEVRNQAGIAPIVILEETPEAAFKQMGLIHKNHETVFEPRDWEMYEDKIYSGQYLIICSSKKSGITIQHDTMALWMKLIKEHKI